MRHFRRIKGNFNSWLTKFSSSKQCNYLGYKEREKERKSEYIIKTLFLKVLKIYTEKLESTMYLIAV